MPTPHELRYATMWKKTAVPDDLITNYQSYLRHRDLLPYMPYNVKVLEALVRLTVNIWDKDLRINRFGLLTLIKQYWNGVAPMKEKVPSYGSSQPREAWKGRKVMGAAAHKALCDLCVRLLTAETLPVTPRQFDCIKDLANHLLIEQSLDESQQLVLLLAEDKSKQVLTRILRHPVKSKTILRWVNAFYNDDEFRHRRAEMIAWKLDENPNYLIHLDLLIADFEYANAQDKKIIAEYSYEGSKRLPTVLDETFPGMFSPVKELRRDLDQYPNDKIEEDYKYLPPDVDFSKRFYSRAIMGHWLPHNKEEPDFGSLVKFFYTNLEKTQRISMLWGLYHSRLPMQIKRKRLQHFYIPDVHSTAYKIAIKLRDVKFMEWLGEMKMREGKG